MLAASKLQPGSFLGWFFLLSGPIYTDPGAPLSLHRGPTASDLAVGRCIALTGSLWASTDLTEQLNHFHRAGCVHPWATTVIWAFSKRRRVYSLLRGRGEGMVCCLVLRLWVAKNSGLREGLRPCWWDLSENIQQSCPTAVFYFKIYKFDVGGHGLKPIYIKGNIPRPPNLIGSFSGPTVKLWLSIRESRLQLKTNWLYSNRTEMTA